MVQYPPLATTANPTAYGLLLSASGKGYSLFATGFRILFLFLFLHISSSLPAQKESGYVVHANIIYRFTKYIDWPVMSKQGDFIIGVVGDSPIYDALKNNIAGKMVGDQKIIIKKVSCAEPVLDCQIIFLSNDACKNIKKIVAKTANEPVLLVSETEGMAQKGSCINFVIIGDRLKLEINQNNIEQRELSIASELLQLGKIVK
jgi:hypothetical protein